MNKQKDYAQQFVRDVLVAEPDAGCVDWPYATSRGYPYVLWHGKYQRVNRLVLRESLGASENIDDHAAHICGNRLCVNPFHLVWCSAKENNQHKVIHGTLGRGERCCLSKLKESQVLAIREDTRSGTVIAAEFDISPAQVSRIRNRKTWGWLSDE